jgi:hypothetical protein
MTEYKLLKKIVINGKKRNIYKKKGSKKQYIKCKGKMMNLVKYKKMKTKKLSKKKKLSRKTKKKGGFTTTDFYNTTMYTDAQRAHMLHIGIEDLEDRLKKKLAPYQLNYGVDPKNEALLVLDYALVKLIKDYYGYDVSHRRGYYIKINLKDANYEQDVPLQRTERRFRRDTPPRPQEQQQQQQHYPRPSVTYTAHTYQGTPYEFIDGKFKFFEGCTGNNTEQTVPYCKVDDHHYPGQKCDNVPNKCKLDENATRAVFGFRKGAKSVRPSGPGAKEAAHNAARELYMLGKGGKKKRVKKSKNPSKKVKKIK